MHMNRMLVRPSVWHSGRSGPGGQIAPRTLASVVTTNEGRRDRHGREIFSVACPVDLRAAAPSLLLRDLRAELPVVVDGRALAEVLQLEQLADLDLAVAVVRLGAALDPLDRLGLVAHLDDPVAGDQLLGLREWAVDHGSRARSLAHLAAGEADACTLG